MYIAPWQVFLMGCIIGTLISLIVITCILAQLLGKFGIKSVQSDTAKTIEADLIGKMCFILLAKGYLDEVDNDFMVDRVSFSEWKDHVEKELDKPELEENEDEDN